MEILVVEDESGIADFLDHGLRAEGYDVRVARDGEAGVRAALDPEVDLVVLDRMLPLLDGLEVLARAVILPAAALLALRLADRRLDAPVGARVPDRA